MRLLFLRSITFISICVSLFVWSATSVSANSTTRANQNRVIAVAYGSVIGLEQIKLESNAGAGAAIGGLIGLATSGGRSNRTKAARTAVGAAAGGAAKRASEGSNQAYEYTVRLTSGQTVKMITDQRGMELNDCVSVEQGARGNIRRVSSVHCEYKDSKPTADHIQEADACAKSKEGILAASTDEELELAIRRTRVLCED